MNEALNKKIAGILGKMDEKVLQAKLNAALDMLKKGDMDELAKKIKKVDKEELIKKLDEIDQSKLKEMGINREDIKTGMKDADFNKLASLMGEHGDEIIGKIKTLLGEK